MNTTHMFFDLYKGYPISEDFNECGKRQRTVFFFDKIRVDININTDSTPDYYKEERGTVNLWFASVWRVPLIGLRI